MLVAGGEGAKAICRIYNEKEDVEMSYRVDEAECGRLIKRYSEVFYLQSQSQANPFANIILGTETGQLLVQSTNYAWMCVPMSILPLHLGEVTKLLLTPDGK